MMRKYYSDIQGANTGRLYEFSTAGREMALSVAKCKYVQDFPAASGFFGSSPAHTETVSGFIGGLMVDGKGADEFRIMDTAKDGPILEFRINGEYHSCPLPSEVVAKLSADGNLPMYSAKWGKPVKN